MTMPQTVLSALLTVTIIVIGMCLAPPDSPAPMQPLDASQLVLSIDAVDRMVDQIPDSAFKSNMLIVKGAHLQGPETDAELNKILVEYALFKLEQIENGNK